jgi:hypothetical protein
VHLGFLAEYITSNLKITASKSKYRQNLVTQLSTMAYNEDNSFCNGTKKVLMMVYNAKNNLLLAYITSGILEISENCFSETGFVSALR